MVVPVVMPLRTIATARGCCTNPDLMVAFGLMSDLKARGVPIDGIGFQAHLLVNAEGSGIPTQQTLTTTFQRFKTALGG